MISRALHVLSLHTGLTTRLVLQMILTRSRSLRSNPSTEEISVRTGLATEPPRAALVYVNLWNIFAMEDADDTLPRFIIGASKAAAAPPKPSFAPVLQHQVTASERFSVPLQSLLVPSPSLKPTLPQPLKSTDKPSHPSTIEIDQQVATSIGMTQSASAETD
jgi:hypothetical protein